MSIIPKHTEKSFDLYLKNPKYDRDVREREVDEKQKKKKEKKGLGKMIISHLLAI